MDNSRRILKMTLKLMFFFAVLAAIVSMQNVSSGFSKITTKSTYSALGEYNPSNNKLMYCGIMVGDSGQILSSNISVKDLKNESEVILEQDIINPPIGWIDSSRVLIYKVNAFRAAYEWTYTKRLYSIDIHSRIKESVKIPLDSIFNPFEDIVVNEKSLIFKTGYRHKNTLKFFKLDMDLNSRQEIKQLQNTNAENITYHKERDMLAYTITDENGSKLMCLINGEQKVIATTLAFYEHISFTPSGETIYFTEASGNEYKYQQVLKSFNIENHELTEHYFFKENEECSNLSAFNEDQIIVSLTFDSNVSSDHNFEINELNIDLSLNPNSSLYLFSTEMN